MFEHGVSYTREEIHSQVGGNLQSYLPHFDGRVVAACLRKDSNPDAPEVVLAGTGEGIEHAAELLIRQHGPVPTFLKRGNGEWEYVGEFEVAAWSQDPADLAVQADRSNRNDITRIIHMIPTRPPVPWLLAIAEGDGRTFEIEGASIPVTVESYRQLVENERLVEDRWWQISQHWSHMKAGDDVFIYTGDEDLGIIGYGKVGSVQKSGGHWCVNPEFNLTRCEMLLEHPVPASVVRDWGVNLRRNPVAVGEFASTLFSMVPWMAPDSLPGEIKDASTYREGSVLSVLVNRYERDADARDECIKLFGLKCMVCGFKFGAVYGSLAEKFIHVHHLKPLAEIGEEYEVNPTTDLRPVCANCHSMIHLGGGCRSIEDTRSLVDPRVLAFWESFS